MCLVSIIRIKRLDRKRLDPPQVKPLKAEYLLPVSGCILMNQMVTTTLNSKEQFIGCIFSYEQCKTSSKKTRSSTSEPSQGCNIYGQYHRAYL